RAVSQILANHRCAGSDANGAGDIDLAAVEVSVDREVRLRDRPDAADVESGAGGDGGGSGAAERRDVLIACGDVEGCVVDHGKMNGRRRGVGEGIAGVADVERTALDVQQRAGRDGDGSAHAAIEVDDAADERSTTAGDGLR